MTANATDHAWTIEELLNAGARSYNERVNMRILSIEVIRNEDLPAKIRARLKLPPLPAEPYEKPNVDFYEFQRLLERKQGEHRRKRNLTPSS